MEATLFVLAIFRTRLLFVYAELLRKCGLSGVRRANAVDYISVKSMYKALIRYMYGAGDWEWGVTERDIERRDMRRYLRAARVVALTHKRKTA